MKIWFLRAQHTSNPHGLENNCPAKVLELADNETMPSPWESVNTVLEYNSERDLYTKVEISPQIYSKIKSETQIWHEIWEGATSQEQQNRLTSALPAAFLVSVKLKNWAVSRVLLASYLQTNKIEQEDYDLIDEILPNPTSHEIEGGVEV